MSKNHCSPDNLPEQVQFRPRNGYASLAGKRFGRLEVLYYVGRHSKSKAAWLCRCDCWQHVVIEGQSLRRERSRSCGCFQRECYRASLTRTHGMTASREYEVWCAVKRRCYAMYDKSYPRYGGRGIRVCKRWRDSFEAFYADMGPRPSPKHSIDRIDNDGNYEPGNCRWATRVEQGRNKRSNRVLTFRGDTLCVAEWAEKIGIGYIVLCARLKYGWPVERALTTPTRPLRVMLTHNGKTLCIADWAREVGVHQKLLRSRLDRGWSLERALTEKRHSR